MEREIELARIQNQLEGVEEDKGIQEREADLQLEISALVQRITKQGHIIAYGRESDQLNKESGTLNGSKQLQI